MGFFDSIGGALVKTVLTPIAIVKDVANVATGQEVNATSEQIKSIIDDIEDAIN